MTEIAAGILRLRPVVPSAVPKWTGPALQAIFLKFIQEINPSLSDHLHSGSTSRPYTVSSLLGVPSAYSTNEPRAILTPDQIVKVRITTLSTELTHLWFDQIMPAIDGRQINIGTAKFVIEHGDRVPTPESRTSDNALVQTYSDSGAKFQDFFEFEFDSPTAFQSKGMLMPMPVPYLLFDSLLNRWNTFNEIKLPKDTKEFVQEQVGISRYRLETAYVDPEGQMRRPITGCAGSCRYVVLSEDRYWLGVLHTLAAYGRYAGVGKDTTIGMGRMYWVN